MTENLTARVFGNLTVIKDLGMIVDRTGNQRRHKCECQCKCGNIRVIRAGHLKAGHSISCHSCSSNSCFPVLEGEASFNVMYRSYKRGAMDRKLEFDLTEEQFRRITSSHCHYCGIEPKQYNKHYRGNGHYLHNGIDRKDNTKGYTIKNSLPCCKYCNMAKRTRSYQEYTEYLDRIAAYRVKNNPSFLKIPTLKYR